MPAFAISTVAMSIYNLIASSGGPMDFQKLKRGISAVAIVDISDEDLLLGIAGLVERGWAVGEVDSAQTMTVEIKDQKRRIVRSRNRNDAAIGLDGRPTGGWTGWLVQCAQQGLVGIEEVSQ